MSDFLDETFNYRYNPFTSIYLPYGIGKGGNPVEVKIIPLTAPYFIYMNEIPQKDSPSSVAVIETLPGVTSFTEVSFTTAPAAGQFRIQYDPKGQGIMEFNALDKGKSIDMEYYGLGSIQDKQFYAQMFSRNVPEHTVDGSLTVVGDLTITGTSNKANDIVDTTANKTSKLQMLKGLQGIYEGASDYGAIYDELAPYFKATGEEIILNGYWYEIITTTTGECFMLTHAERDSASTIIIYFMKMSFTNITTNGIFQSFVEGNVSISTSDSTPFTEARIVW